MPSFEEINNASPEELKRIRKVLANRLARRIIVGAVVAVGIAVTAELVSRKTTVIEIESAE